MPILAIETSTPQASLAVLNDAGADLLFETQFSSDRAHNSRIFEPLKLALEAASSLTRVVVGTGPGSYSGVRVGIAVANGLAAARGVEAIGFPTLCSLLENGLVVGDARRNSFFIAEIAAHRLKSPPQVLTADEFAGCIEKSAQNAVPIVTMDAKIPLELPEIARRVPQAREIGRLAAKLPVQTSPIEPVYVREPYITQANPKLSGGAALPRNDD